MPEPTLPQNLKRGPDIRLALTGGTGFLGRRLTAQLDQLAFPYRHLDGNIAEAAVFDRPFNALAHMASPMPQHFSTNAAAAHEIALAGVKNALNACERNGARLIFISSSAVYEVSEDPIPLPESTPRRPATAYGISKLECEDLCLNAMAKGRVMGCVLRLFNSYGHGQDENSLLGYVAARLSDGKAIQIKQPEAQRDFIHISDIALAVLQSTSAGSGPINIGSGKALSVRSAVLSLVQKVRQEVCLEFSQNSECPAVIADLKKAKKLLNWHPSVTWDIGVDEVLGLRPPLLSALQTAKREYETE